MEMTNDVETSPQGDRMRWARVLHKLRVLVEMSSPCSIAAISVLYLFASNAAHLGTGWRELRGTLLLAIIVAGTLTAISLLVFRRQEKLGLSIATLICMATMLDLSVFLFIGGILFIIVLASWALRALRLATQISFHLLAGWTLICILALLGAQVFSSLRRVTPAGRLVLSGPEIPLVQSSESMPDVYYIIVDGHGRSDVLRDMYAVDNSSFVSDLKSRGFVVAEQSRSNYMRTFLSLASSLNMRYLTPLSGQMADSNASWPVWEEIVRANQVTQLLRALGYTIFDTSGFSGGSEVGADRSLGAYRLPLTIMQQAWLQRTAFAMLPSGLISRYLPTRSYESKRRESEFALAGLPEIASVTGPKFVFAHIMLPHPPFVFDAQGRAVDPPFDFSPVDGQAFPGDQSDYLAGYAAQTEFTDSALLQVIDGILANSATPPIIVIQGDHGAGSQTDFDSVSKSCLWERFSILNAYYLPGVDPKEIPADMTPVNTFRLVFNHYFGADLPLEPNRQYFSETRSLYDFIDVTDDIGNSCASRQDR